LSGLWKLKGKCANDERVIQFARETGNDFFMDKKYIQEAKRYGKRCPVIELCLQEGLTRTPHGIPPGVWGGQSERERRKYLRDLDKRLAKLREQMEELLQDANFPNAS
jgi:hypothetical protein